MFKIIGFIITFCILAIPFSASAKSCNCNNHGMITASGAGTVKIKPDGSRLYVAVSIFNKSHRSAYRNLIKTITNITSRFKNYKAVKLIKTVQINIAPNRYYDNGKWTTSGYNATENLIIKIHGNKNTNYVVLYLLKYKSTSINRIAPIVSNMKKYKIEAVKLAYKHAISKIKAVLKLIGAKSYTVKRVDIKSAVQRIFPVPVMMQASIANAVKKIYFPGKDRITAQVFVKINYNDINNK
jgi:uncharacterized protein YggE